MSRHNAERRVPLTLIEAPEAKPRADLAAADGEPGAGPVADVAAGAAAGALLRPELGLKALADELAEALVHVERAALAAKGTGFSGRVRDVFDLLEELQRSAAAEFGRRVGDRMGRETLWRRKRAIDLD